MYQIFYSTGTELDKIEDIFRFNGKYLDKSGDNVRVFVDNWLTMWILWGLSEDKYHSYMEQDCDNDAGTPQEIGQEPVFLVSK